MVLADSDVVVAAVTIGAVSRETKSRHPRLDKLRRWYVGTALVVWNSLLLYLLLNLVLGAVFLVKDVRQVNSNEVSLTYGRRLDAVYPDLPEPGRTQMLSEAWNRPYRYADFIHFQERPCVGTYVNVSEAGYRHSKDQGPWPPSRDHFNIFCFGGSTMFAYGLPDEQTLASCLQEEFGRDRQQRVCVYNFGVGYHFSTQERLRFEQLLAAGHVPDCALFLDGINDTSLAWSNQPAFSPSLASAFERVQAFGAQSPGRGNASTGASVVDVLFLNWPVGRATRSLSARLNPTSGGAKSAISIVKLDANQAAQGCATYRWNRTLIEAAAKARGVTPLFIVQPAPGYKLDPAKHSFANADLCRNEALFYAALKKDLEQHPPGKNLIWCADLVAQTPGPLYVDTCHYTAAFSRVIAEYVAAECRSKGLLQSRPATP